MNTELLQAIQSTKAELAAARNPSVDKAGRAWGNYELARVALAANPGRELSIAYVLGIVAGAAFDNEAKMPDAPFAPQTRQADDFATGIKDAIAIGVSVRLAVAERVGFTRLGGPALGDAFDAIFCGGA